MSNNADPIELRPRAHADGRVDVANVRWTLEHMHNELAGNSELGRVRNALAIALLEIDRAQNASTAQAIHGAGWSGHRPFGKR